MTNDTPITITLTRRDLCDLALACTNARQHAGDAPNASKWTRLHDTIMAEIIAADEAEQQPTETEEAPQAAPVPICTIAMNEGDGRQTITWNPADGMLYSDAQEAPADGYGYSDAAEALDAASYIWGNPIWEMEII